MISAFTADSPSLATTHQGQKSGEIRLPFVKPAAAIHVKVLGRRWHGFAEARMWLSASEKRQGRKSREVVRGGVPPIGGRG
jgi:hypothetical protein